MLNFLYGLCVSQNLVMCMSFLLCHKEFSLSLCLYVLGTNGINKDTPKSSVWHLERLLATRQEHGWHCPHCFHEVDFGSASSRFLQGQIHFIQSIINSSLYFSFVSKSLSQHHRCWRAGQVKALFLFFICLHRRLASCAIRSLNLGIRQTHFAELFWA